MPSLKPVKRGDTFQYQYSIPLELGAVITQVRCQLRLPDDTLIQELTVTPLAAEDGRSRYQFLATAEQTAEWPLKNLNGDIKHVATDGTIMRTENFSVSVIKAVTL